MPKQPELSGENREKEKQMLYYIAVQGEAVEATIPDAEGALKQRITESQKDCRRRAFLSLEGCAVRH
jgi:hypothetical protein